MRKSFLLVSLCMCFGFGIQAQDYHLGLQLAYLESSLQGDGDPAFSLKNRQSFAMVFNHTVEFKESPLGFTIGTGYILKGARINSINDDYRLHYLNMPVLLDIRMNKLKLSLGPELAYLANARNRTSDSTSVSLNNVFDKNWEFSGSVALSYALDFFVEIGAKYNRGFTKYSNSDALLNRRNQYNSYFQLFFMFKIAN